MKPNDQAAVILNKASEAARAATAKMINENPGQWYPCGFAWVTIKPARGPFVSYLKEQNIGHKAYGGGWQIWNPSENATQWMDAKKAGADAFAKILQENGIKAEADCRMD
jgi:hypothetical protein